MSRRTAGSGSVLPHRGGWRATASFRIGEVRYRPSKVFERKKDAEEWLRKQLEATQAAPSTFGDWVLEWKPVHQSKAAPKTWDRDFWSVDNNILPHLGTVRLRDLTPLRIEKYFAELQKAEVGSDERRRCGRILRKILNAAVIDERIPVNPINRVKLPKHRPKEIRPLSAQQAGHLCWVAGGWGEIWEYGFRVWIDGAMRPNEFLALQWEHLDREAGTVKICQSLDLKTHQFREPKTPKSRRTIPLSAPRLEALERAGGPGAAGPMFPTPTGKFWRLDNFGYQRFKPIAKEAGVEWAFPYTLRHTAASLLLSAGCSIPTVSARLGHERPSQTLDTYAHLMPNDQRRATETLGRLLSPLLEDQQL